MLPQMYMYFNMFLDNKERILLPLPPSQSSELLSNEPSLQKPYLLVRPKIMLTGLKLWLVMTGLMKLVADKKTKAFCHAPNHVNWGFFWESHLVQWQTVIRYLSNVLYNWLLLYTTISITITQHVILWGDKNPFS